MHKYLNSNSNSVRWISGALFHRMTATAVDSNPNNSKNIKRYNSKTALFVCPFGWLESESGRALFVSFQRS